MLPACAGIINTAAPTVETHTRAADAGAAAAAEHTSSRHIAQKPHEREGLA